MAQVDWDARYATRDTPWDSGVVSVELQRVVREHGLRPGRTLEVGCGTGTNAIWLAQQGHRVTAFDLAAGAIDQARKKAQAAKVEINFRVADIAALPDAGSGFDLLFDRGVYHSVRPRLLPEFLLLARRALAPGALAIILTGNANDTAPEDRGPPRVHAHELAAELSPVFELVALREFRFDGVIVDGKEMKPLGWSALLRARA